jgi:hypothetical protein
MRHGDAIPLAIGYGHSRDGMARVGDAFAAEVATALGIAHELIDNATAQDAGVLAPARRDAWTPPPPEASDWRERMNHRRSTELGLWITAVASTAVAVLIGGLGGYLLPTLCIAVIVWFTIFELWWWSSARSASARWDLRRGRVRDTKSDS